ncbi:S-layer homology domain-containing protein [Paenibacillus tarimensis]|uniref:S-layer homology domain-containing protein n=1 Tax=Paenibacillus tarimensis TaxID=416012 RepID=UPI001F1F18D9|nr:S-layer homology domain-containing protein [Paenibacillus tarimensis]MCF2946258.1 S-layer homology domain-containing protein [Paenibacillus tarimensis]
MNKSLKWMMLLVLILCSLPLPAAAAAGQAYPVKTPQLKVVLSNTTPKVNDTFQADFWMQGFVGDYKRVEGIEFHLAFDPALVEPVVDGSTGKLEAKLFPEASKPITWSNTVDKKGKIAFAQTLPPKSKSGYFTGSGKIGSVTFRALKEGSSTFQITDSLVILPGLAGLNVKHAHNSLTIHIGSDKPPIEKLEEVGTAAPEGKSQTASEVITAYSDAKEIESLPWAKEAIASLTDFGALKGNQHNTFRPKQAMTRAEFVQLLVVALGMEIKPAGGTVLTDIKPDDWYYDAVTAAAAAGAVGGYKDKATGAMSFKPNNKITRAEISTILARLLDNPSTAAEAASFRDVKAGHWAHASITKLAAAGIVTGGSNGRFSPEDPATRAEVCVMVHRLMLKQ